MSRYQTTLKRLSTLATVFLFALALTACDSFVSDVDQPVDEAGSEQFSDPAEADFLITGVQAQWADTHTDVTVLADALSDEFRFGINGDATFPTYAQLDAGIIQPQNNSIQGASNDLGEYRYLADDLLRRVEEDEEFDLSDPSASASEEEVRFAANIHGANARYYLATYFGDPDNPRRGGGVIDTSEFIPSPQLYQQAEQKYANALAQAEAMGDAALQRRVQSVRARNALYAGTHDFEDSGGLQGQSALEAAAQYAQEGFTEGESWAVRYDLNNGNDYHFAAGAGRLQLAVQDGNVNQLATRSPNPSASYRVADEGTGELVARNHVEVVANNPEELSRIPLTIVNPGGITIGGFGALPENLEDIALDDALFASVYSDFQPNGQANEILGGDAEILEWGQGKWEERTNMPFMDWRELFLIRAELEMRGLDAGDESALELVNAVRASYGEDENGDPLLEPLSQAELDMERLAIERDRTLFATGSRLPDQRRLDQVEWHLKDEVSGQPTWQWLRIDQSETEANPNL